MLWNHLYHPGLKFTAPHLTLTLLVTVVMLYLQRAQAKVEGLCMRLDVKGVLHGRL